MWGSRLWMRGEEFPDHIGGIDIAGGDPRRHRRAGPAMPFPGNGVQGDVGAVATATPRLPRDIALPERNGWGSSWSSVPWNAIAGTGRGASQSVSGGYPPATGAKAAIVAPRSHAKR